jgi:hypothetical protein
MHGPADDDVTYSPQALPETQEDDPKRTAPDGPSQRARNRVFVNAQGRVVVQKQ